VPSVEKYRDQSRNVWRYRGRYLDAGGRKRSRTFDTKAAAMRWAGEEESKVHRGQQSNPNAAKMKWAEWGERWLAAKNCEPRTRRTDQSTMRAHVAPRWGTTPLLAITRMDVQGWVNTLSRERSASTARKALYQLSASLTAAVKEGILVANPCATVEAPTNPHGQERYLTDAEAGQILYHLSGRWRVFAEFVLGTGLRMSEATGLHVARVDLAALRVDVVETYDPAEGDGEMRPYGKNKRRRSVPLSPELAELLQAHLDLHPPAATCGRTHRGGRCPSGLLFTGEKNAPVDAHNFGQRQWRDACERAGFYVESGVRRKVTVRPHDLRHSYASRLVQLGVPLERVQLLLGHQDLTTTQRYAHLAATDGWDEVRAALSTSVTAARAAADGPRLRAI
jgi:integrase